MSPFAMEGLVCVILALALYPAKSERLENPISLLVLKEDLRSLKITFPTGSLPEDRVIKYDDRLKVVVRQQYSYTAENDSVFFVRGTLTLTKLQRLYKGGHKWHSPQEIHGLFFRNGLFYYKDSALEPELRSYDPLDYFIVDYEPPKGKTYLKPVIEYIPKLQLESELKNFIPKIIYESVVTGGRVIKTYFYSTSGLKIHAEYDIDSKMVVYKADFHVVTTDEMGLYKKTVLLDTLRFDLVHKSFPEFEIFSQVFGVSVTSVPPPANRAADFLTISRKHLLKDVTKSSPTQETSSSGVVGMIKFDRGRMFSLNYIETNQRQVLRIAGRFVTQGHSFCCICIATPHGQLDKESVAFSKDTVLFSCSPGVTETPRILLKEDTDFIEMESGYTIVLNESKKLTRLDSIKPVRIEPYLEYISYEEFLKTLQIVSDAMRIRCANDYHLKSYRLFLNVFLVYDCNAGIASFDNLDLWLRAGHQNSFLWNGLSPVTYDSKTGRFSLGRRPLSDFKLRQLHSIFPAKVPPEMMYMYDTFYGDTDVVVDFESVEWDLYNIRKSVFKSMLAQAFGVICVDDNILFRAEKLQEVVNGETRWMVAVKGVYDVCAQKECEGEHLIMYDGAKLISRDSYGSESAKLPDKVYLPQTSKLSMLEHVTTYQERYVTLNSFRIDMEELTVTLQNRCDQLKGTREYDEKLTIYVYYFGSKEPMIGYYECTLKYIFFFNDFKVIKYPNGNGASSSYRPGEELKFTPGASTRSFKPGDSLELIDRPRASFDAEEEELRGKYSDYILRDLIYDQTGRFFHSKSLFMAEVYALRVLPSYVREKSQRSGGMKLKLKKRAKVVVYGQDAPKSAWM